MATDTVRSKMKGLGGTVSQMLIYGDICQQIASGGSSVGSGINRESGLVVWPWSEYQV